MVWILFPKEEDTTRERSNGSFIRTWKKGTERRARELKSTSRWQWVQDRKLLHRQFNFTQQNHKLFYFLRFPLCLFYWILLPFDDDHNIFVSFDCGDSSVSRIVSCNSSFLSKHRQRLQFYHIEHVKTHKSSWKLFLSTLRRKFSHETTPRLFF